MTQEPSAATGSAEQLLEPLDDEQRQAASALLGPVCILAGAGTGKTRAISHRIAYGVATGAYPPARVMALTFTTRAAGELRSRLRSLGAGGVNVRTFHSAALAQLNHFWPQLTGGPTPRVLAQKGPLLAEAASSLRIRVETETLRDLAAEIEWRKVGNLTFEQYELAARSSRPELSGLPATAVLDIMRAYETLKDTRAQIDFEDVLLLTAGMVESEPTVALQIREQYRFFVVDEFQDVSPLQNELLSLWIGERSDVCVVGDASQTIYSFAGASAEFLLGFPQRFPGAQVVRLERNYRSQPGVVGAANRLMRDRPGAVVLRSAVEAEPALPTLRQYPSDVKEAEGVASRIWEAIQAGTRPEDIAVLYRVNVQSAHLERALAARGVPYAVAGSTRFFERAEVQQAIRALRAASISVTGEPLFKSVSDVLRSLGWSQQAPQARGAVRDAWDSLNALMSLAEQAPEGTTFRAFTDELLAREATKHEPDMPAVTLATMHSAKGLEWPHVFVVGLSEGLVPISYAKGLAAIDEERRLLYVGVTRARNTLELSWAVSDGVRSRERAPSRFLAEFGPSVNEARPHTGRR